MAAADFDIFFDAYLYIGPLVFSPIFFLGGSTLGVHIIQECKLYMYMRFYGNYPFNIQEGKGTLHK